MKGTLKKKAAALAIGASALTGGTLVANVAPAHAAQFTGYIDFHAQCKRQGSFASSFWNYWNPYSRYCYTISLPFGISYAGGLDLNWACREQYPTWRGYPATVAKVVAGNNVNGWRCVNY